VSAPRARGAGFTLLPVILAMSLVAAIAFLLNRDNVVTNDLIGGQSERARARYAAEAGLQAANYAMQAAGCAGGYPTAATPVTDADFGGASYSAYADAASGSPRSLSSTGAYKGASVTLTRAGVYVYQSPMKTYTIQPNPAAGIDTHVRKDEPNKNYGGDNDLELDAGNKQEILIKFDLSIFPAGSRIIPWYSGGLQPGATLDLYKGNSGTSTASWIDAQLITRSWVEGTGSSGSGATWNRYDGVNNWPSPGVGYDARTIGSTAYSGSTGWKVLDITNAAQAWMGTVTSNYGVWLRSSPSGVAISNAKYNSSDNSVSGQRPRAVINYLLPCGASAP